MNYLLNIEISSIKIYVYNQHTMNTFFSLSIISLYLKSCVYLKLKKPVTTLNNLLCFV